MPSIELNIGDQLPPLTLPVINRTTLALYAGASGDHNEIHINQDFARKAGMPDVFAHGMLSAAYLGRMLTNWIPQEQHRKLSVRFTGITHLGNQPSCTGTVTDLFEEKGERRARITIQCSNQFGEEKLVGEAIIAI